MEYIFEIGDFGLRWYSVLVALGLAAGAWIATFEARRRSENHEHVYGALFLAIPGSLIGARIYHVVHEWDRIYSDDLIRIVMINEGGIGIYGAIVGAIAAVTIYSLWNKLSVTRWLDIGAPGFILGQAIGRWGNYFNQELYGSPTELIWGLSIPMHKRVSGYESFDSFHPLFFYESALNLIGFALLMYLGRRWVQWLKDGDVLLMYGVWYGTVRLSLEGLRIDNWTVGAMPIATIISILILVGSASLLIWRHRLNLLTKGNP